MLDKEINTLYNQYASEEVLKELKYKKLDLKMQITRLETQLAEAY
jgi:hypothetical protein